MPPERPRAPGPSGAAAQAAIAWAALAAAHVVLSGTAPRGVLRDPLLSPGARLALLALELVAQALAVALLGAGFADFPLIAYHFKQAQVMPVAWIPLAYAVAMGTDALAALALGDTYDRLGVVVMVAATLLSALFAPLVFLGGFGWAILGMVLWGIGMGAQESVMRAAVADLVASNRRASAYGIFQTGYGLCWFLGSVLMGLLYDHFLVYLIIFSVVSQILAIPIILVVARSFCPVRR